MLTKKDIIGLFEDQDFISKTAELVDNSIFEFAENLLNEFKQAESPLDIDYNSSPERRIATGFLLQKYQNELPANLLITIGQNFVVEGLSFDKDLNELVKNGLSKENKKKLERGMVFLEVMIAVDNGMSFRKAYAEISQKHNTSHDSIRRYFERFKKEHATKKQMILFYQKLIAETCKDVNLKYLISKLIK